jgi:uncharacterized HhH-GPD family protein
MSLATKPERLHFTGGNAEADELIARDAFALLVGLVLDQQVTVQTAFAGPLKLRERLGTLDPAAVAAAEPAKLEAAFREKPAVHRFPGSMAQRVQELAAFVVERYGGDAERIWVEAADSADLRARIGELPGFGALKIVTLGSILSRRFHVDVADELVPDHPTLGDVDSDGALARYQEAKRARKAQLKER